MANAKKCDRCGIYFDGPRHEPEVMINNHMEILRIDYGIPTKNLDLCEKCAYDFETWFEELQRLEAEIGIGNSQDRSALDIQC